MARRPRPWYRKQTGWWMVTLGGKQHKLAEGRNNRRLAEQKFHELMLVAGENLDSPDLRVVTVCDEFLQWSNRHQSLDTYRGYHFYLQSFAESCGHLSVSELKPFHVSKWVDSKPNWISTTTQYNAIRSAIRAFNWAAEQKIIRESPLKGMKRPRQKSRDTYLDEHVYRSLRRLASQPFKYFLFALRQTGARPKEVRELIWAQVHEDRWILKDHKTAHTTGRPRVSDRECVYPNRSTSPTGLLEQRT